MENLGKRLWEGYKECELYLVAQNVISLFRSEALSQLKFELEKYSIANAKIQKVEMPRQRWLEDVEHDL